MERTGTDQISYIPLCDAIGNYWFQSIFDNHDSKVWSASTACKRDPSVPDSDINMTTYLGTTGETAPSWSL